MKNNHFKKFSKLKTIFIQGENLMASTGYKPLHTSVLVSNKTTFEEYYSLIKDFINTHWEDGYDNYVSDKFEVIVTKADRLKKKNLCIFCFFKFSFGFEVEVISPNKNLLLQDQ
jgi:hypothetical protein